MVLGEHARKEIMESIKRCRNSKEVAAEVSRLAAHHGVGKQRIYELTKEIRSQRKTRADRGKRAVDINTDPALRLAVGRVLEYGASTAESLNMSRMNGEEVPVTFTTVNRYMKEAGLDKKTRRTPNVPHRRFEASAPGEMFQFDISGVKERWYDHATRRIISVSSLEVSKNHPNEKAGRVRVWRFCLIDDFSRRCFIRYVGVAKPNSSHVVDFLLQAYAELGVPHVLYTDNDAIIKFGRNARTTDILNKVLLDRGGYKNQFHFPGNARATGKVERLHQTVEQAEKFIGTYIAQRGYMSLEVLNDQFAVGVQNRFNSNIHSETGQAPMDRWESKFSVIRRLDYESLRSAFMADEFVIKLRSDLTLRHKGKVYQLPVSDMYPFANWAGQKLRIVFPDGQPFFTVIGLDGMEYDVVKDAARPNTVDAPIHTGAETLRKDLRKLVRDHDKAVKLGGAESIPFFDEAPIAAEETNVTKFPKPEQPVELERVAAEAPGRVATHDPAINFWEAVSKFEDQFGSKAAAKEFFDSCFASRGEECWLLLSELEAALERRQEGGNVRRLKAV
jgi:hypothetical protein